MMNEDDIVKYIDGVRHGDQEAFERLMIMYRPLTESLVTEYSRGISNAEDVKDISQEALIAFFKAIISYDTAQKNVTFGAYAKTCIKNRLIWQTKKICNRAGYSIVDIEPENIAEDSEDIASLVAERDVGERLLEKIKANLSQFEINVWELYLEGVSGAEIAKKLGKSPKSIGNAIYRIRQKLKDVVNNTR